MADRPTLTRAQLTEWAVEHDVDLIFYDPPQYFDHAIVGVVVGFNQEPAVLYDMHTVIQAMAKDMGEEGALEWFGYNTIGAYMGTNTPRFLEWLGENDDADAAAPPTPPAAR